MLSIEQQTYPVNESQENILNRKNVKENVLLDVKLTERVNVLKCVTILTDCIRTYFITSRFESILANTFPFPSETEPYLNF